MKAIIVLIMLVLIPSCGFITKVPKRTMIMSFDYKEFTEKGFLFSNDKYHGESDQVGYIATRFFPSAEFDITKQFWEYEKINSSEVLNFIYREAIGLKANAAVELIITPVEDVVIIAPEKPRAYIQGVAISCKLIKRK